MARCVYRNVETRRLSRKSRISRVLEALPVDPGESAAAAGLRYVSGDVPGILRKKSGRGFTYIDRNGNPIRDPGEIRRIRSLVIPPAWTEVWICPSPRGHLQAVGRDARGRKQYRYHPMYRQVRDQTKFGRMIAFAAALPGIRQQVENDMKLPGLPKRKVVAAVVRLLETTFIRVGNDEYAKENGSYGLTTLRDRHVEISGHKLSFYFRGKSGQVSEIELSDRRLARIVKQCRDIPGYELFQYLDDAGQRCKLDSNDVNEYLRDISGEDFTAKDFRTWAGTLLAVQALAACGASASETEISRNIVDAVKMVAARLGNRPATCRKYYVHPAILDAYSNGVLMEALERAGSPAIGGSANGLSVPELCAAALIRQSLQNQNGHRKPAPPSELE